MKKRWMIFVLGGLIAVSAVGMSLGTNVASAADPANTGHMMQGGQAMMQDSQTMAGMMNQPEMRMDMNQMPSSDMTSHQTMF